MHLSTRLTNLLFLVISASFLLAACGGGKESVSSSVSSSDYFGVAQKGPLLTDSMVLASPLGKFEPRKAQVLDEKGTFKLSLPENWGTNELPVQLQTAGFFLSEVDGKKSKNKIQLSSLSNNKNALSINLLTEWSASRIKQLLSKGKSFIDAKRQAETELNKIFGVANIHQLDISRNDRLLNDNASLLLLSGALAEVAHQAKLNPQTIIDELGADFAEDGVLNTKGDDWFMRMQARIRVNPALATDRYARVFNAKAGFKPPSGKQLPEVMPLASRPVAIVPKEIFAEPGETIVLDGSASHDSGNIINFTWFRVDQQTNFKTPFSDRFSDQPTITVPDEEAVLLYALVVTDEDKLTHTALVKVIVKIVTINEKPVADNQTVSTDEDNPLAIVLTGSDPEGDPINFNISTPMVLPNGLLDGTPPNLTYTPNENFNGTETFNFTVDDGQQTSDTATITIEVNPVADPPVATDQDLSVGEDNTLPIVLTGSDPDVGDTLTFTHTAVSHGTLTGIGTNLSYTPDSNYNGNDSFTYKVTDSTGKTAQATITIQVNPVNDPPVATPGAEKTEEDVAINITLKGTDIDGDNLSFSIKTNPLQGTLDITNIGNTPSIVRYTPSTNYNGTDAFDFTVTDPDGAVSDATVDIQILPVNDAPIAKDYTCTLPLQSPPGSTDLYSIDLSGFSFTDPEGDAVSEYLIDGTLSTSPIIFTLDSVFDTTGKLTAQPLTIPPPDVVDSFKYKLKDVNGAVSNSANVKVIYK